MPFGPQTPLPEQRPTPELTLSLTTPMPSSPQTLASRTTPHPRDPSFPNPPQCHPPRRPSPPVIPKSPAQKCESIPSSGTLAPRTIPQTKRSDAEAPLRVFRCPGLPPATTASLTAPISDATAGQAVSRANALVLALRAGVRARGSGRGSGRSARGCAPLRLRGRSAAAGSVARAE